ncbi:MAG: DnaD domain protein [Anaerolineae bacterium]|nr:DnaD domain protein [Anaerolineae bacterium]
MPAFKGFQPGKQHTTRVPNQFFSDLLPTIDNLVELKLTLYCFWALQQQEGAYRYVIRREVLADTVFLSGIDANSNHAAEQINAAFVQAVERGTLLQATVDGVSGPDELYFMNTAQGRNAIQAIADGRFEYGGRDCPVALIVDRPNIFTLYEQNIGPLTPMIGEELKDAENEYPAAWIQEAIQIAVERNTRNWRYILGILKRWQAEGKNDGGTTQQSSQADRYRYITGADSDIIKY